MKKIPYWEKLKDPRWQKKRLEIMSRDEFCCQSCGDSENPLSVHHRYYVSGREPWEYPGFALRTLCESCHSSTHEDIWAYNEKTGERIFDEWEYELDWVTTGGKDHQNIGGIWHVMAELSEGLKSTGNSVEFLKKVERAICSITAYGEPV